MRVFIYVFLSSMSPICTHTHTHIFIPYFLHSGTHPLTGNILAKSILEKGLAFPPSTSPVASIAKEVTLGDSRFDFVVTHADGRECVVECKSVPLADYCDGDKKERAAYMEALGETPPECMKKVAIFPEGYRKKKADPVSPRALKHVQELERIAKAGEKTAMLLFIVQRCDVDRMSIAKTDMIYREAVEKAYKAGVMMKAFSIRWEGSEAYLHRELPFLWD